MAGDFADNLASMDLDAVQSFYDEPAEAARDIEIGLPEDQLLIRTPTKRRCFNALHLANLSKALTTLPAPGESWHIVARGNWPAWSMAPRILELVQPAKIQWLGIATLGFSKDNVDELCSMMDAGDVGKVDLIYSCYFRSHEETLVGYLTHEMQRRGQRIKAIRNHAKIIAAELTNGQCITVESSANLRSCRNVEQFTLTSDPILLSFHRDWMNMILEEQERVK